MTKKKALRQVAPAKITKAPAVAPVDSPAAAPVDSPAELPTIAVENLNSSAKEVGAAANTEQRLPTGNRLEQESAANTTAAPDKAPVKKERDYKKEYQKKQERKQRSGGSSAGDSTDIEQGAGNDAIGLMVNGALSTSAFFLKVNPKELILTPEQLIALESCAPEDKIGRSWVMYGITLSLCIGGNVAGALLSKRESSKPTVSQIVEALKDEDTRKKVADLLSVK